MATTCAELETTSAGRDLCDLLDGSGAGLGSFLDNIRGPLAKFIAVLALIGAIVAIVIGVGVVIKKTASAKYS